MSRGLLLVGKLVLLLIRKETKLKWDFLQIEVGKRT